MRGRGGSEVALVRWPVVRQGQGEHLELARQCGREAVLGVDVAQVVVVQLVVVVDGLLDSWRVLWVCEGMFCCFYGFLGLFVVWFVSVHFVGCLCRN